MVGVDKTGGKTPKKRIHLQESKEQLNLIEEVKGKKKRQHNAKTLDIFGKELSSFSFFLFFLNKIYSPILRHSYATTDVWDLRICQGKKKSIEPLDLSSTYKNMEEVFS